MSYPYKPRPCDKSSWPNGPWKGDEPDSVSWQAEWGPNAIQLAMIRHNTLGHWCGYARVPDHHPLFGKSYNDRAKMPKAWLERPVDIDKDIGVIGLVCASINSNEDMSEATLDLIFHCHGGLTYSDKSWFGFDCAHAGDMSPGLERFSYRQFEAPFNYVYRDFGYVRAQCERLAAQLSEYAIIFPQTLST